MKITFFNYLGLYVEHKKECLALIDDVLARLPLLLPDKDAARAFAEARRVEASGWYRTPVHPDPADVGGPVQHASGSCRNAEVAAKQIITRPLNLQTSKAQACASAVAFAGFLST